jgi:hypothetical protein
MSTPPRISVVTPSFNQGRFLAQAIDSVRAQGYPELEHIVVDGLSGDETPAVLARYPHLRVVREPDRGPAEAINKGFRLAAGDILCYLNADDTFLPGALRRVAEELARGRGRHVVTGRCVYTDEGGAALGVEHPWQPAPSRRRVLEVWKGNCVPQPATFWTAEAWRRCGPLDEQEDLAFDYDLMCRFSRHYRVHAVDQVLATYRLHPHSLTCSCRPGAVVARGVRVSRRYWGSPAAPLYWRLRLSLAAARLLAPARVPAKRWLRQLGLLRRHSPLTLMWQRFTGMHPDGGVGPLFVAPLDVNPGHRWLRLQGTAAGRERPPLDLRLEIDGRPVVGQRRQHGQRFTLTVPVAGLAAGAHQLTVASGSFFVPHDYLGNGDFRPLAFRLHALWLSGEEEGSTA